jgi:hypothetical protein
MTYSRENRAAFKESKKTVAADSHCDDESPPFSASVIAEMDALEVCRTVILKYQ